MFKVMNCPCFYIDWLDDQHWVAEKFPAVKAAAQYAKRQPWFEQERETE